MNEYNEDFWNALDELVNTSEEEMMEVYKTHNETQYMKGVLIRR